MFSKTMTESVEDFIRNLTRKAREFAADRHYFSTACQHNEHALCRLECKFCGEPCKCHCHKETQ